MLLLCQGHISPLQAAPPTPINTLIHTLRTAEDYKLRVTAATLLSKYPGNPAAGAALIQALTSDSHPTVQGAAALALGHLGEMAARQHLENAARSRDKHVKQAAKEALELLAKHCEDPDFKTKRFYLHMGPLALESSGISVDEAAVGHKVGRTLQEGLASMPQVTTRWPRCKTPTARDLKKMRKEGYMVEGTITLDYAQGALTCKLKLLVTTFPSHNIKMMKDVKGTLPGKSSMGTVNDCLDAALPVAVRGIKAFINMLR